MAVSPLAPLGLSEEYVARVRSDFTHFVTDPAYPCLGARAALRRGGCRVHVYGAMTGSATTRALARDLATFARDASRGAAFVAFAALFVQAAPSDEATFEAQLWSQLSQLATIDPCARWADDVSSEPGDPNFAFSFARRAFFVVGLHPESSRLARRLPWPALVFNPHTQFRRLRAEGRFERLRGAIRARDVALQGDANPSLADAGERSEARQYSGRVAEATWRCPFHRPEPDA